MWLVCLYAFLWQKKTQLHKITNVKLHWWLTIESDVTCRIQTKKGWRKSIFIRWNGILVPFFEAQHGDLEGGHWHRTLHQLKEKKKSSIHCGTGVCKRGHEQKQQSKQTEEEKKKLTFWHRVPFHEDLCYRVAGCPTPSLKSSVGKQPKGYACDC